jgi:SET domain-containing protein
MMECNLDDCPIGENCENRRFGLYSSYELLRFQKLEYAPIEVIRTDKKGFGIRTHEDLYRSQFVIEYCGEVIPQSTFVKRTREYSDAGVSHFYFMSLRNDEIIDALKKGNISRFVNHSCNPNCVLQKWVVQNRIRMGLFTLRSIAAGEELTFDYKFERYGEKAQPCYCGESVCQGVIGSSKNKDDLGFDMDEEEEEELNAPESEVFGLHF